ncbi:cobalt ABC transporter permease [Clostridium beijerinckii]|uniref:cobalt ABC transporter permease n=1 Tax=Clostridium beijerinckii TaxID=1520 RepID=UPI001F1DCADD|nr:cobalt ABC transporter permease [Clostridium beijerinckii]
MKELIISQIAPIVATGIVGILVVIIKTVGSAAVEVLAKKKEQIEQAIIVSGHEQDLATAKEVWNIVEEKFRITENAEVLLSSKADQFNNLLLQRIPGLTQRNLDDLRQAIAGEFNKNKVAALSKDDAIKQLQDSNTSLQTENASLKDQLSKFQSLAAATVNADTPQATV